MITENTDFPGTLADAYEQINLKCYGYREGTGEYTGSSTGDISPVDFENGVIHVAWPRLTTQAAPPEAPHAQIAVFDAATQTWSLSPNHIGETWWTSAGEAVLVDRAGDPADFDPPLRVDPPPPVEIPDTSTMAEKRQRAFDAAIAYGNAITARVTKQYADVEVQSWTAQEAEARTVLAGGTLSDTAMLPHLASDRGIDLTAYAQSVVEKADAYRMIAVAAVRLRRGAEGLLSEAIDTPEKLGAAVEALRAQTLAAAQAVGIEI